MCVHCAGIGACMRHGVPIVVEASSDPEDDLSAVAASMGGVYVLGTVGRQGVGPTTYLPRIHKRGLAVVRLCMPAKAQSCVCIQVCVHGWTAGTWFPTTRLWTLWWPSRGTLPCGVCLTKTWLRGPGTVDNRTVVHTHHDATWSSPGCSCAVCRDVPVVGLMEGIVQWSCDW